MNQYNHFAIEEADVIRTDALADSAQWRLLRRLQVPDRFNDSLGGTTKRAVVVDVETTGLSIKNDDVVQLAMLPFDYDVESGRVLMVHKAQAFEELREPAVPISEEAALITGITDDVVAGKSIDAAAVSTAIADVDLVIAHNAYFDRAMVERHWDCFAEKPWACTLNSVDWLSEGFSAGKLDYLGMQFGWFYDGHQALTDCEACLALLAQTLPKSGRRVMEVVRESALQNDYLIRAVDAPYDLREKLKQRRYYWRPADQPNGKVWWTITTEPDTEVLWLQAEIYGREKDIPIHEISALSRFSERIWDLD